MTTGLVRCKRLVWVKQYSGVYASVVPLGQYSIQRTRLGWISRFNGVRCASGYRRNKLEAIADCQNHADEMWLAMTDVPDLVWDPVMRDSHDRLYAVIRGGHAYIYPDGRYYTSPNGPAGDAKSVEEAKVILNAHERQVLLGE